MQQGWITRTFKGDRAIWGLVVLFMVYSLLAVYSSSVNVAFRSHGGNTTYFLRSQFFMLLLSLVIIVIVHYLPYRIYFSLAGLLLIISAGLLVLTLVFGARVNEATRWLVIPGTGFRLQTSDVAKVALVIYLARTLARYQGELNNFMLVTKYFMIPVAVICALIMPENLSTSVLVFGVCMIILFIGRVPVKFLLAYVGLAIAGVIILTLFLSIFTKDNRVEVWKNRIENHFAGKGDDDSNFQSNQAKIAISTGGLFGKAPGRSTQRNMLPQSNSDFIFAIIIEEYGLFLGAIPLILAYMILLFRGIAIAKKCDTAFPAFLVLGLIIMIVVQAMINMMVAVGIMPVTGQTLPMVSWGRTSVLMMSFSIGAILSVSRVVNARIRKEELPEEELTDEGEKIYEPAKA
ncbi:MAG TPA: FtsW/RodA/SpoVE family cell cycle protein [Bacteroidales bacterium]|mgnify:FL=1|jgi:cell division protein FtsW|nr:FtsW/RodA/SpoVE family cell cycle protein [Bacteroidales bacterium]HPY67162.1 FtsW/RodA/SpoVE family cell cycle protein [Bacteroidales bacterium]HQB37027.1 FtsW/RodA/SpoVE family cell cycle protein [Bacteroidales bacterium]